MLFDELLEELDHVEGLISTRARGNSERAIESLLSFSDAYWVARTLAPRAGAEQRWALLVHLEAVTTEVLHLLVQETPVPRGRRARPRGAPDLAQRFAHTLCELRLENNRLK